MKPFVLIVFLAMSLQASAQTDSLTSSMTFSGFVDAYYLYDFNRPIINNYTNGDAPDEHMRPTFLYNHNRHNEFNMNLALVRVAYITDRVRGNLGIQVGTYAQYNYAGEEGLLRNVFEANAGVRLARDLWLDAGVFASHIGSESAISKDCWTPTRSLSAENTPYYLSGAKLTYAPQNSLWSFTGLAINGWQRIRENNQNKAIGTQIQFKPNAKLTFNSSTFVGNEQPTGSPSRLRYFHDFYATWQLTNHFGLMALADVGFQRKGTGSRFSQWSSWVLIARYRLSKQFFVAGRIENYTDTDGVIITSTSPTNGFQTKQLPNRKDGFNVMGFSLNLDYRPTESMLFRMEGRWLQTQQPIFVQEGNGGQYTSRAPSIATSLAVNF